jgi:hypothetical protein
MADHDRTSWSEQAASDARPPTIRSVVVDGEALVRVQGTLETGDAVAAVVAAVCGAVGSGAFDVVLDLARVDFAGVELVARLGSLAQDEPHVRLTVLSAPKTMLLAVTALRMRHLLVLREEPTR